MANDCTCCNALGRNAGVAVGLSDGHIQTIHEERPRSPSQARIAAHLCQPEHRFASRLVDLWPKIVLTQVRIGSESFIFGELEICRFGMLSEYVGWRDTSLRGKGGVDNRGHKGKGGSGGRVVKVDARITAGGSIDAHVDCIRCHSLVKCHLLVQRVHLSLQAGEH